VVLTALAAKTIEHLDPYKELIGLDLSLAPLATESRREFENQPMSAEHANDQAVLVADVAAFYEYVDHQALAQEILDLTADVDLSTAVSTALRELTGREFGLPQGPRGSDVFADLYLGQVVRKLTRKGWSIYRLRDEFLVPTIDEASGHAAQLDLEEALHSLGLSASPAKTDVLSDDEYVAGVTQIEARLKSAAISDYIDYGESDSLYAFDPEALEESMNEIDWEDLTPDRLEELFDGVFEEPEDSENSAGISNHILAETLPLLGSAGSLVPLNRLAELVEVHPHMTRESALYLRLLGRGEHAAEALGVVEGLLLGEAFLYPWTVGWFYDVLARTDEAVSFEMRSRLEYDIAVKELPTFALGRAVIALGRQDALPDQSTINALFIAGTDSSRADIVSAVQLAKPDWKDDFNSSIGPDEPLLRAIAKPSKPPRPKRKA
jgi:hypothetical protein